MQTCIIPRDKHLCLITDTVDGGGIGMVFLILAKALTALGHRVDIVTFSTPKRVLPKGVKLVVLETRARSALGPIGQYFRHHKPDIIISARDYIHVLCAVARRVSGLQSSTLIWSFHTHQSEEYQRNGIVRRMMTKLMFEMSFFADHLVAVSQGVAQDMRENFRQPADRISVIYNPVDVPLISKAISTAPFEGKTSKIDGPQLIVACGRLVAQKGFCDLIDAFAKLRQSKPVHLVILGEGPLRMVLEEQIFELGLQKCVSLPGHVAAPVAILEAADCFVSTSLWEGFGMTLAEALACGCPIVATDCNSGPREILLDGALGALVPVRNVEAIAGGMLAALCKADHDPQEGKTSLVRFDPSSAAKAYLGLAKLSRIQAP
jgi:glycosyltransferase involved in cell wall biosynthesis